MVARYPDGLGLNPGFINGLWEVSKSFAFELYGREDLRNIPNFLYFESKSFPFYTFILSILSLR